MARTIPSNVNTSLDDAFIIPVWFVHLDFDTIPLYLHTDLGSITTLSQTWVGTGGLGSISPIEETEDPRATGLKLRLDITDESAGSIFEEINSQDFYQRPVTIYFSTRDTSSGALLDDPFELFRGKCDVPEMVAGHGQAYVEMLIESEWADGEKANGELYSDAQLQSEYSGDLGFQFLTDLFDKRLRFGPHSSQLGGGGSGGGQGGGKSEFPNAVK